MFLIGIILIFLGELDVISENIELLSSLLIHVGMALIISSIIGLFLEMTEIKDFFENRLVNIISQNEFVDMLSEERLLDLAVTAIQGLGRRRTTNPAYNYDDFGAKVRNDVLENIGKTYRKDYFETIDYSVLRDKELPQIGILISDLKCALSRVVSTTRYEIISPEKEKEIEYEVTCFYYTAPIPGLAFEKQFSFELDVDGERIALDISKFITTKDGKIEIDIKHKIKVTGSAWVEMKLISLEDELSGHFVNYMNELTQNVTLHFSSREELVLNAEIFGMTVNYNEPSITNNSVSIQYPGWALPGHGYFITWKRSDMLISGEGIDCKTY